MIASSNSFQLDGFVLFDTEKREWWRIFSSPSDRSCSMTLVLFCVHQALHMVGWSLVELSLGSSTMKKVIIWRSENRPGMVNFITEKNCKQLCSSYSTSTGKPWFALPGWCKKQLQGSCCSVKPRTKFFHRCWRWKRPVILVMGQDVQWVSWFCTQNPSWHHTLDIGTLSVRYRGRWRSVRYQISSATGRWHHRENEG